VKKNTPMLGPTKLKLAGQGSTYEGEGFEKSLVALDDPQNSLFGRTSRCPKKKTVKRGTRGGLRGNGKGEI